MPRTLRRNLQLCFPKITYPTTSQKSIEKLQTPEKCTQNPSNLSSILVKNFNSLYQSSSSFKLSPSSPQSNDTDTTTPDLSTVYASQRFFFSSPGQSNSIIESATSSSSSSSCSSSSLPERADNVVVEGGVPIPTLSPDPYVDFRRSMQEMVEARDLVDVRANWEHLHELLTCYLSLNPKSTHKFIVGAFADLLVSLMKPLPVEGGRRNPAVAVKKPGKTCNNDVQV
ncbi:Transcription repressor [Heracleum sosnowskyi]|uniref:Transcription repressor n=1 Tax=Heracleum sosnowskyi TaxID=360622 RepID=A0AAD8MH25_9APIA|nr:Transcription repressor [Heracleum sosnowskyi]